MEYTQQPSTTARFMKGAMSGALSGALMMGIVGLVSLTGAIGFMGLGGAAAMVLCTSLFSGIMGVVRTGGHATSRTVERNLAVTTPIISQSVGHAPNVTMDMTEDMAPARADGKSWAETAGRSTPSNIDSILANGALSDKGRAEAILAERQNSATAGANLS